MSVPLAHLTGKERPPESTSPAQVALAATPETAHPQSGLTGPEQMLPLHLHSCCCLQAVTGNVADYQAVLVLVTLSQLRKTSFLRVGVRTEFPSASTESWGGWTHPVRVLSLAPPDNRPPLALTLDGPTLPHVPPGSLANRPWRVTLQHSLCFPYSSKSLEAPTFRLSLNLSGQGQVSFSRRRTRAFAGG